MTAKPATIGTLAAVIGSKPTQIINAIGTIYSATSWANLSAFQTNSNFSVSSGKIQVSAGSGYLRLPEPTQLDSCQFVIQYKVLSLPGSDTGLQIGFKSVNTTTGADLNSCFSRINLTTGANFGRLYATAPYSTGVSTGTLSVSVNDVLRMTVDKYTETTTVTNLTAGGSVSCVGGVQFNTSKFSIYASGGTYEIQEIGFSSDMIQGGTWVLSDSIGDGAGADSKLHRWVTLAGLKGSCGSGDKTTEILARMNEILTLIKPTKVFLAIGTNDALGLDSTTFHNNYISIVNSLEASGCTVVKNIPIPRNDFNMTGVRDWILSQYPTSYINLYAPLLGSGTNMNAAYNSGDGVHPNTAGHSLMASTVMASSLY